MTPVERYRRSSASSFLSRDVMFSYMLKMTFCKLYTSIKHMFCSVNIHYYVNILYITYNVGCFRRNPQAIHVAIASLSSWGVNVVRKLYKLYKNFINSLSLLKIFTVNFTKNKSSISKGQLIIQGHATIKVNIKIFLTLPVFD